MLQMNESASFRVPRSRARHCVVNALPLSCGEWACPDFVDRVITPPVSALQLHARNRLRGPSPRPTCRMAPAPLLPPVAGRSALATLEKLMEEGRVREESMQYFRV